MYHQFHMQQVTCLCARSAAERWRSGAHSPAEASSPPLHSSAEGARRKNRYTYSVYSCHHIQYIHSTATHLHVTMYMYVYTYMHTHLHTCRSKEQWLSIIIHCTSVERTSLSQHCNYMYHNRLRRNFCKCLTKGSWAFMSASFHEAKAKVTRMLWH